VQVELAGAATGAARGAVFCGVSRGGSGCNGWSGFCCVFLHLNSVALPDFCPYPDERHCRDCADVIHHVHFNNRLLQHKEIVGYPEQKPYVNGDGGGVPCGLVLEHAGF
jgi:hypothetical protein